MFLETYYISKNIRILASTSLSTCHRALKPALEISWKESNEQFNSIKKISIKMWRNFSILFHLSTIKWFDKRDKRDDFKTVVELELWLSYLYLILYRVLFTITM